MPGAGIHGRFNFWDKKGSEFTIVVIPDTQFYVHFFPSFFTDQIPEGKVKDTTIPVKLGGYDGPGLKFKGKMDEVKIFNKALTPEQTMVEYTRFR